MTHRLASAAIGAVDERCSIRCAGGVMNTAMELGPTVGRAVLMSMAATQSEVFELRHEGVTKIGQHIQNSG